MEFALLISHQESGKLIEGLQKIGEKDKDDLNLMGIAWFITFTISIYH